MDTNKKMNKFDIDIEIKDILWELIRGWRVIAALAIICAVALTAYQYRIDMNKTDVVTVKKTQEQLEASMGTQDLDEVTAAVALRRQADERSAYMEASYLMRINPYQENVVFLQYYVEAEDVNIALDANDTYIAYVNQGTIAKEISEQSNYEMEQVYLAELISIVKEEGATYINAKSASDRMAFVVENGTEERVFTVKVVGATKEAAETLAADVKASLQQFSSVVTNKIGTHQLQLINENATVIADQSLAELQNWNATSIKTISNNLDSMKNEMTGDQITLYTYRTTVVKDDVSASNTKVSTPAEKVVSISLKHTIIGAVIGVVLGCGVIAVLYLFAAALRNGEEVKKLYGIHLLGYVDDSAFQKKKLFGFVDNCIIKLQNGRKKKLTFEEEIQMVCSNIVLNCERNGVKAVFAATSAANNIPQEVMEAIVKKCMQRGIKVVTGNDLAYDAECLEDVVKIGQVVFIEKEGVSLYDEIYEEIVLCKQHNVNVIGMVVVGV